MRSRNGLQLLFLDLGSQRHFNRDVSSLARGGFQPETTADLLDSFPHSLETKTTPCRRRSAIESDSVVSQADSARRLILSHGQVQFTRPRVTDRVDNSFPQSKVQFLLDVIGKIVRPDG